MRRFHVPALLCKPGESIELPPEAIRHLATVLRQQAGARLDLFDGQGNIAGGTLEAGGKTVHIDRVARLERPAVSIELIQALAKGEKLELVLQKGTELGLSRFILTPSERTVVKLEPSKKNSRIERWLKIVQEACRQCGQPFAPGIEISSNLDSALATAAGDLRLMLWEEASLPLQQLLPAKRPGTISLLVGPEGGFSSEEARRAIAAGFHPVRLGPRILRTETAGLAILSILQYVYGDFSSDVSGFSSITHGKELS